MNLHVRGLAALSMAAALVFAQAAIAQKGTAARKGAVAQEKQVERTTLGSEREKISYMIGMDVGQSIAPTAPDLDLQAFGQALRNAFDGGKPVLSQAEVKVVDQALRARIAARDGKPVPGAAPGAQPPAVDKTKVGQFVGGYIVGPSLARLKSEIELPVLLQAVDTTINRGQPLLAAAEADALRKAFAERMQARMQGEAAQAGAKNQADGVAFLAKNKTVKGVFTTPSGLQYMVLRQGAGARPAPGGKVRVNYQGSLLDGTVFDSSYERGEPVEFALDQVIAGWTEGVAMMPVGAKYRFWVPSELAYGANGTPGGPIGPNSTLIFDVELLGLP